MTRHQHHIHSAPKNSKWARSGRGKQKLCQQRALILNQPDAAARRWGWTRPYGDLKDDVFFQTKRKKISFLEIGQV